MTEEEHAPAETNLIRLLMVGEIYGKTGRRIVSSCVPQLRQQYQLDIVVANGESAAGGVGLTASVIGELLDNGIDVITSGNRVFDQREMVEWLQANPNMPVLRPLNYPAGVPGKASLILETAKGAIEILNLNGRVYFNEMDSPFRVVKEWLHQRKTNLPLVIDFHAEATSEKVVLGWYLDGLASAVLGTHNRVATADARLLHHGTAHVSDVGMVGSYDSIGGMEIEAALKPFIAHYTVRPKSNHKVTGLLVFNSVLVAIEPHSGRAISIKRLDLTLDTVTGN